MTIFVKKLFYDVVSKNRRSRFQRDFFVFCLLFQEQENQQRRQTQAQRRDTRDRG